MNDNAEPGRGVTWVVVADAARAQIFSRTERFSALEPLRVIDEPRARSRERDLIADSPGRSFDSHGQGRHAMDPGQSAKAQLREAFARRIAAEVESGRAADRFQHLVIVATPDMLGAVRAQLSRAAQRLVTREIAKQMTQAEPATIAAEIDAE